MSESKKIIAALLMAAITVIAGCIIVDCSMADLTKERPLTISVANYIYDYTITTAKALIASVKAL